MILILVVIDVAGLTPTLIVIDMVSVKLRCTLKGEMKEFVFSAKNPPSRVLDLQTWKKVE
jgi:hypothetical protein